MTDAELVAEKLRAVIQLACNALERTSRPVPKEIADELKIVGGEAITLVQTQRQGECQCCIALKNLVELKTHKDKFGKDRDYRLMQPSAWEFARSTLPSPPTEDKHDIK